MYEKVASRGKTRPRVLRPLPCDDWADGLATCPWNRDNPKEDGSWISNDQIRAALEQEAGEPLSDAEIEEAKNRAVAMGAAEKARGPGGGLKAPDVEAPARAAPANTGPRTRRSGIGAGAPAPQAAIAPGNTAASVLTGELRNQIDRIWDAFWSGGIANPLEPLQGAG